MRYPKFLLEGGCIGFAAPSFGCATEPYKTRFDSAREYFKSLGYREKLGPNCYLGEGIGISNTPEKCGRELMDCYMDSESDILISCGGGELMCETISHVDFDTLAKANPKWYLGYSDNTNMTFLLNTICDTAAVYGPCAGSFGIRPLHQSHKDTLGLLTGAITKVCGYDKWERCEEEENEDPLAPYHLTEDRILKVWTPERGSESEESADELGKASGQVQVQVQGRLIGGCMDCLVNLLGTRFDRVKAFQDKYCDDGFIWFLESCDLNVFSIRRAMWQMEEAGWFRYVKGFLIGRPLSYGQEIMGLDTYEAVLGIAKKYQVPVIMDADLGHLPPAMPIVSGSIGTLRVSGNDISLEYEYR